MVGDAFHEEDVIDALRQANNNEERAVAMLLEQAGYYGAPIQAFGKGRERERERS